MSGMIKTEDLAEASKMLANNFYQDADFFLQGFDFYKSVVSLPPLNKETLFELGDFERRNSTVLPANQWFVEPFIGHNAINGPFV